MGINIKERYLNDIELFKSFIVNISKTNNVNNYNEQEFWNLLLLLSRSYLNDNFHKMFDIVNEDYLKKTLLCCASIDDFKKTTFLTNNDNILKILLENQKFIIEPFKGNYKKIFRIIRNHLSHYNYELNNNIVNIYEDGISISFSIATLVLVLLATLSNVGQSNKIGAYDNGIMFINDTPTEIEIKKIKHNNITPMELLNSEELQIFIRHNKDMIMQLSNVTNKNELTYFLIATLKETIKDFGREKGFNITVDFLDKNITKRLINKYDSDNSFVNLYNMLKDDIKRATLIYKFLVERLYMLYKNNNELNIHQVYSPIINNSILINYLDIVFCDYAIRKNNKISDEFFEYIIPKKCSNIPTKIRNSLAHCHYKIFDDFENVVFEFWDQDEKSINFECKIKKSEVEYLIEEYIASIKKDLGNS